MKIKNIKNPRELFQKLDTCKGDIELITKEGDRLNLKSKLCQYVMLTDVFANAEIKEMELLFSNPDDVVIILEHLIRE